MIIGAAIPPLIEPVSVPSVELTVLNKFDPDPEAVCMDVKDVSITISLPGVVTEDSPLKSLTGTTDKELAVSNAFPTASVVPS